MIDYLKYRWRLSRILSKQRKNQKKHGESIRQAKEKGEKADQIESLRDIAFFEYREYEEEIGLLVTKYQLRKVNKLMLPTPEYGKEEFWEQCQFSNEKMLTEKGITELRTLIR